MAEVRRFAVAGLEEAARRSGRRRGLVIGALDETAQVKQGDRGREAALPGLRRQGRKRDHHGPPVVWARGTGQALAGARQWIPAEQIADPVRALVTGLPPGLAFRTKGQLAIDIVTHRLLRWVDCAAQRPDYGDGPGSADNGGMVRCTEAAWYRRYRRVAAVIFAGGGCAMIAGAAVSLNSASVPLLLIGSWWILVGAIIVRQGRRWVTEIVVTAGVARLISASAYIDVPATDITEIRHARFDVNRMGALTVETTSNGRIRAVPRLEGLLEVLIELRQSNPALLYRNL